MAKTPVIAIVDDDEGVRTSLASLVRSLGYEARTYGSGDDFLRQPPGEDPACMIADIQMPVMTGDELQARLVASGRHFPIIFMTAFPTRTHAPARHGRGRALLSRQTDRRRRDHPLPRRGAGGPRAAIVRSASSGTSAFRNPACILVSWLVDRKYRPAQLTSS